MCGFERRWASTMRFIRLVPDISMQGHCTEESGQLVRRTHPARYNHEMPYAAVTIAGGTTGRNASPMSLVWCESIAMSGASLREETHICYVALARAEGCA